MRRVLGTRFSAARSGFGERDLSPRSAGGDFRTPFPAAATPPPAVIINIKASHGACIAGHAQHPDNLFKALLDIKV